MTRFGTFAIAASLVAAFSLPAAAQKSSGSKQIIAGEPVAATSDAARAARAQARDSMTSASPDAFNAYGGAYIGDGVDGPLYAPYAPGFPGACITDEGYGRYYSCDGGH